MVLIGSGSVRFGDLADQPTEGVVVIDAPASDTDERGVRATVALWCIRPDLIGESTLEEIGHGAGRSKQAVHQLAESFRETTGLAP